MSSKKIYTTEAIREIERAVIEQHGIAGITLMQRAGEAAFQQLLTRYADAAKIAVVCGGGNNGGDGYVVAQCARKIGIAVTVLAVAEPATDDAAAVAQAYLSDGGDYHLMHNAGDIPDEKALAALTAADLIVDALFGIGLRREPQGAVAELIRYMNAAQCPVVSLDMPSGLQADTGYAFEPCIKATATVTFIDLKLGLLTGRGRECAGDILTAELNIPTDAKDTVQPCAQLITQPTLARRARDMHKGDAGRVLVVGGARGMFGAGLLAGEAALRCGSGLVTVAGDGSHVDMPALRCPELMSADALILSPEIFARVDVVVFGVGLGRFKWSEKVFKQTANHIARNNLPTVMDADALFWLARTSSQPAAQEKVTHILTPHSGEAAALLQCTAADIEADRAAAARKIAARFNAVCVLKGAGTLVACGTQLFVCDKGNPGMATAGMGDVLSGIIGALLASGMSALEAAVTGVWIHAHAADCAAQATGERSLLARDVITHLAPVLRALEKSEK